MTDRAGVRSAPPQADCHSRMNTRTLILCSISFMAGIASFIAAAYHWLDHKW